MLEKSEITVVTCTHNRSQLLVNAYKSLCKQVLKPDIWLIIDNCCTDSTAIEVNNFKIENVLNIEYVYEENKGKHYALMAAFSRLKTKYFVILDDDDEFTEHAIYCAASWWNSINASNIEMISAVTFSEKDKKGNFISGRLPSPIYISSHCKLYLEDNVKGDRTQFYRSELFKNYKYPTFEGLDYMTDGYAYFDISRLGYNELYIDTAIKIKEYRSDGLTKSNSLRVRNKKLIDLYNRLLLICCNSTKSRSAVVSMMDFNVDNIKYILSKIGAKELIMCIPIVLLRRTYKAYKTFGGGND